MQMVAQGALCVKLALPGMEGARWRSEVTFGLHERCTATLGCDLVCGVGATNAKVSTAEAVAATNAVAVAATIERTTVVCLSLQWAGMTRKSAR